MSDPDIAWASPPVDDIGYISSASMLELRDDDLIDLVVNFEHTRYNGWRNFNGNWRRVLKMDETTGKRVQDWGCGVGIEGLQYARAGNEVVPTDIVLENVLLAERVISLMGYETGAGGEPYDVIHASGSLHHSDDPRFWMQVFREDLVDGGEVRLMLYSDWAWRIATGLEPPDDTEMHALFETFVRRWDAIGSYADWYDEKKVERLGWPWFELENFEYLTQDLAYCGAVLVKR